MRALSSGPVVPRDQTGAIAAIERRNARFHWQFASVAPGSWQERPLNVLLSGAVQDCRLQPEDCLKSLLLPLVAGALLSVGPTLSEREVTSFIAEYDRASLQKDTVALERMMGERYVYFSSKGATLDKRHILGWYSPAHTYVTDVGKRSEVQIAITGSVAVVGTHWQGSGSFDGQKFTDDQRCSLTIAKEQGALRLLAEHCTQIVP